jgi:hypothetical protein
MWKRISSLFAVSAIGKSIFVPRLPYGSSEARDERNDAHRVFFPRDLSPPVPGRVPLVDWLEARLPGGRSRPSWSSISPWYRSRQVTYFREFVCAARIRRSVTKPLRQSRARTIGIFYRFPSEGYDDALCKYRFRRERAKSRPTTPKPVSMRTKALGSGVGTTFN